MASVSLIEGFAKKFINMVPRPFYTEAAQKLVHEICETIYKDLETEDNKKYPRVEIIDIVENFVKTHLLNTETEEPSGIRKAIEDSLAKTTLEVYKDDKINMLILQQILSEEIDPDGNPMKNGIFYKSLEQSINLTNDPDSNNSSGVNNEKDINDDNNKKKDTDKDSETFAKKVVNELVNTNVEIPIIKGGDGEIADAMKSAADGIKNAADGATGALNSITGDATNALNSITSDNPLLVATAASAGSQMLNGSGSGNQPQITNIGYEENKNGVLPYIQTNCNGVGLGLPGIDLNFLAKIFDGLKKPIAEELVKKIQERLPDKTTDSLTIKRDIYDKILLVIQAHLQSQQGKDMLLGHIDRIIKKEVDILTTNDEIKKRLLKVIFKNKSSEIYKKLIEIIALHSSQNVGAATVTSDTDDTTKSSSSTVTPTSKTKEPQQNGGKESKLFHVDTIEKVIQEFSKWLNEKIGSISKSVMENPVGGQSNDANQELPQKLQLADVVTVNSKKKIGGEETSISTSVDGGTTTESINLKTDIKSEEAKPSNENVESSTLPIQGGRSKPKNKTKKRRAKNNKRKTSKTLKNKQKKRVTKKKNRKPEK